MYSRFINKPRLKQEEIRACKANKLACVFVRVSYTSWFVGLIENKKVVVMSSDLEDFLQGVSPDVGGVSRRYARRQSDEAPFLCPARIACRGRLGSGVPPGLNFKPNKLVLLFWPILARIPYNPEAGKNQRTLKLGDGKKLSVAAVGTLELIMKTCLCIKLYDTLYIPEISRNLVSGPKLDMDGFYVSHGNGRLTISSNSQVFGTGLLDGGLYKLELDDDFSRSLLSYNINENSTKTKRKRDLETSSMLWHQRLGHISRDRLSRLVKDEVLPSLDFTDFGTCVKCLKGKMTTATKKGATRSSNLLEIIHTDISGPYTIAGITGHTSFITFIDDYSRYMYLYLIKDKSESLTTFKDYKTEVENQLDLKIKVVRSDRGGEYYGRHTDVGQAPGPFYEFCKGQGIVNQYTMPGTPQQNGVAERRNRTLMNMSSFEICP
ncbi:hypothetical protein E3N88_25109 [Mikania micrantha]|uniref:Integrase catalytic domain-containing protein n=1 Tax=Mikania micrantha TaxID=192012 RepID=A0A5N6N6N2_9ASTR|nr:hypothetical protein E3N88_25109 [Mikania micrantha]